MERAATWALEQVEGEGAAAGRLPEEVVERILACMAPVCLMRMRGVCRRWQSILNDDGFLSTLSGSSAHAPCFLMTHKHGGAWQGAMYSAPTRAWHALPMQALIPRSVHSVVASAGGLVCFAGLQGRHDELFVCNPLRGLWKRLPGMPHPAHLRLAGMLVDERARRYRIVTAGDHPTQLYDSASGTWHVYHSTTHLPAAVTAAAFCCGSLYCLTGLSPSSRLVAFHVDRGAWESVPVRMPRSLLDAFLLAGPSSSLLLVGRLGLYCALQSLRMWTLDFLAMEWVEVSRMPHPLFAALLRSSADSFQCFGHGRYICFSAQKQHRWLLFDLSSKVWHWFGGCPLVSLASPPVKKIKGVFFEPRLDAILL